LPYDPAASGNSSGNHQGSGAKGFVMVRQSGSHKIFRNPEGTRITVPFHSGKILHPKLLKSILEDAGLSVGDLHS